MTAGSRARPLSGVLRTRSVTSAVMGRFGVRASANWQVNRPPSPVGVTCQSRPRSPRPAERARTSTTSQPGVSERSADQTWPSRTDHSRQTTRSSSDELPSTSICRMVTCSAATSGSKVSRASGVTRTNSNVSAPSGEAWYPVPRSPSACHRARRKGARVRTTTEPSCSTASTTLSSGRVQPRESSAGSRPCNSTRRDSPSSGSGKWTRRRARFSAGRSHSSHSSPQRTAAISAWGGSSNSTCERGCSPAMRSNAARNRVASGRTTSDNSGRTSSTPEAGGANWGNSCRSHSVCPPNSICQRESAAGSAACGAGGGAPAERDAAALGGGSGGPPGSGRGPATRPQLAASRSPLGTRSSTRDRSDLGSLSFQCRTCPTCCPSRAKQAEMEAACAGARSHN